MKGLNGKLLNRVLWGLMLNRIRQKVKNSQVSTVNLPDETNRA